jgi:hypothetical protein
MGYLGDTTLSNGHGYIADPTYLCSFIEGSFESGGSFLAVICKVWGYQLVTYKDALVYKRSLFLLFFVQLTIKGYFGISNKYEKIKDTAGSRPVENLP